MFNNGNRILSWNERIGYGSGDYALNLYWQGIGFFLFFFYTDVLGIPNTTAGIIFLVGGIWDAVSDPLMGYIAERSSSKRGTYRPFLLYGSAPLAVSGILLFSSPAFSSETVKAIYVLVLLLVFRSCYTIVSIPYSALGARLTTNSKERTRISGVRMYCGYLGGLSVSAAATILRGLFPDDLAFQFLGIFMGLVAILMLFYCYRHTQEMTVQGDTSQPGANTGEIIRSLAANRPLLFLLVGIIFVTVCNTFVFKNLLYYFEYFLGDAEAGNYAFFILTATPLISIPFWSATAVKMGKRKTWQIGGIIILVGTALLYVDQSGSTGAALIEVAIIVWGSSAYAVLLWAMLPDVIDYGDYHTGVRNESMAIGVLSSMQKAAIALSALLIGQMLDMIGYEAGAVQSIETLTGLKNIITLVPLSAIALSMAAMHFYPLDEQKLLKLREAGSETEA